jgi:CRISPR type III-B/RAMP module-associated protein Cmr5
MTDKRTLEQQRVEAALRSVESVPREAAEEYRSLAQGFPAMLVSSGIAPALAFLEARAKRTKEKDNKDSKVNASALLSSHVAKWVLENCFKETSSGNTPGQQCLKKLSGVDSVRYRLAEREAVEFAVWVKRFAQAYLK